MVFFDYSENKGYYYFKGKKDMKKIMFVLLVVFLCFQKTAYSMDNPGCMQCHGNKDFYLRFPGVKQAGMYISGGTFSVSVHKGISCTQCHTDIKGYPHPAGAVIQKTGIPVMCSACHHDVYEKYTQSIHWSALEKGINAAPVCTDCHGTHGILKITNPAAKVYPENIPKTCSSCHDSVKLAQQYNLPLNRLTTYENSFHGIALKFGDLRAANCASCHGVHEILPSSDPRSSINKANLPGTCGKCHPNATANFVKSRVHVIVSKHGEKGPYIVRVFYTWFIGILITIFIIYVIFDLLNTRRKKKDRSKQS
jgi:nitrate/TMAO reductase-like tetraheme cytochrome c subunit